MRIDIRGDIYETLGKEGHLPAIAMGLWCSTCVRVDMAIMARVRVLALCHMIMKRQRARSKDRNIM